MHWVKARVEVPTPTPFRHWAVTLWTVRLAQGTPVRDGVNSEDRDGLDLVRHVRIGLDPSFDSTCVRFAASSFALRVAGNQRKSLSGSSYTGQSH